MPDFITICVLQYNHIPASLIFIICQIVSRTLILLQDFNFENNLVRNVNLVLKS